MIFTAKKTTIVKGDFGTLALQLQRILYALALSMQKKGLSPEHVRNAIQIPCKIALMRLDGKSLEEISGLVDKEYKHGI